AGENVVAIFLRPKVVLVIDDAGNGRRAVLVENHRRREAEAVVRFAEARIMTAAQELIDRFAVAVGRVKIAERVKAKSERIDLAPGVLFAARAVQAAAPRVAGCACRFIT